MICFYYGLTALACVWYFRDSLFSSTRNVLFRFLAPLLGGLGLIVVFLQTAIDSWDPAFGSGSEVLGVGLVFVIGIGILIAGVVIMLIIRAGRPGFFQSQTLTEDSSALVIPD
jgi:hypothetical protein